MSKKGIGPVPDALARLDEAGFLEQLRKLFLDVQAGRLDALAGRTVSGGSSGAPVPGPPGPPGPPAAPSSPDLTPPPTPSGVIVTAGINAVYITTDAPIFTQGHGYNRTIVYGAKYGGAGPLPTFSDAVVVHEFVGQVGSFPSDPGDQWHIWLKWRSDDQVESVSPSGGANGHQVTTATIGNVNLGPLIVEASNLANGAVTTAKFAAGIEPVSIVGALPSPVGYTGPKTVLLTTDGKLYRYVSGAWTSNIAAVDLVGQITSTQITDGAITTPKLAAGAVTANEIAAGTITANEIAAGTITANELAADSVTAGKIAAGAIGATEIAVGAIQALHMGANSIAVGSAAIQNGAIVNAMLADATITDAKIANLSASKLLAGSIAVGEYIQSSDFVSGSSGWRLGGNTAEIGAAHIRGQLTAAQIDSRNLTIRDGSGNVIFGASQNLDISRLQGGMKLFKATAWGRSAGSPTGNLIDGASGASLNGAGRSYIVNVIRRSDGVLLSSTVYDVWGSSANATAMATALNALTSTVVVVVRTYDEPRNNRLAGGLPDALYRCGANPAVFGTPDFKVGAAYILIGIPGCGPCNGYESYAGSIDDDPNALIEASFYLHNGNIITTGTSASPRFPITSANVSTFIANAAIGNAQIGGDIWSTNYVPGVSGWVIERGGYAEFENVKVRGDVQATSVNGAIVDTGHIVQNAVTTLGYTFSATTSTLNFAASTTLQRVDLISVTATSTGSPQQVIPGGFVTVGRDPPLTTTIQYALELWRDSTMLVDSLVFSGDFDYGAIHLHLPVYIDHPSAGSHTYTVRLRYLSLGSAQNMFVIRHVRALQILEVKR